MTEKKSRPEVNDVKAVLAGDDAFIRSMVRAALQEVLEAEMTEAVGPGKGERTATRVGYPFGLRSLPLGLAIGQTRGAGR
jgi:putative transposase